MIAIVSSMMVSIHHQRWPEEALVRVGEHYLEEVPLRRSMRDTVISAATLTHKLARFVWEGRGRCEEEERN